LPAFAGRPSVPGMYKDPKTGYIYLDSGLVFAPNNLKTPAGQWFASPVGSTDGNSVITYAGGGSVMGAGSWTSDSIPAMLSNGEYVTRAASVAKYGVGFMNSINQGTFNPKFPVAAQNSFTAPSSGTMGGSTYNINVTVNNEEAQGIADLVTAQIQRTQRMVETNRRISI